MRTFACIRDAHVLEYQCGLLVMLFSLLLTACGASEEPRFTLMPASHTNIHFENVVEDTPEFNILNYLYFYDGGGVAVGDINNDGLPDIFFVGNDVENRLYLNRGDFVFEDITESAGVAGDPGSWSTGATMADVNGNGYLDIYVSRVNYLDKTGANQLFINNGDGTFTERGAEFGLDFVGYSTQAVFFDYNNSGRLDLFLLNHSFHGEDTYGRADVLREVRHPKAGDRLFRNDGDRFTDVTEEAGIFSSALGYGLGVAVSDITRNGWLDIYVGNDFHEDDYLYINNGDGTFTEALYESFGHTSRSSMGNDIADFTNNGYVDVISLDMMPEDHETYMRSGGPDLYMIARIKKDFGFGEKNARNTLQLNMGHAPDETPVFSEIAFAAGVAKTEWSWASLFADLTNDGWKDLFITNGMVRRPNDLDFVRRVQDRDTAQLEDRVSEEEMASIRLMPEVKVPNYAFRNNGDLTFTNMAREWGFARPSFSSGAAYADLNNNGRLDLVVNNTNMPAFIYRNNTPVDDDAAGFLKVRLEGSGMNTTGIGSKVILCHSDRIFYQENIPTRGFQSSVDHVLHFGLGDIRNVDSLLVIWPDRTFRTLFSVDANQTLTLSQDEADGAFDYARLNRDWDAATLMDVTDFVGLDYRHQENTFNDYGREPLMPYKLSTEGPALAVGDVTGNGLDDIYLGGARWQAGRLFIQQEDGRFVSANEDVFERDSGSEDVDAVFFDATGNGLLDLYVVSGGGELAGRDESLRDRLYINAGNGRFEKSEERLPEFYVNGSVVRPGDFNGNGHIDLFVGGRSIPHRYGLSPRSYLLENDGSGYFADVTETVSPELAHAGMVTDAQWAHMSGGELPDLIVAGEWMPIMIFRNDGERLDPDSDGCALPAHSGLWQSLLVEDLTGDGRPDVIAGNFGLNSRLKASPDIPMRLYINDYDGSGQTAAVLSHRVDGHYYPFEQLDELLLQFRFLSRNVSSYADYATSSMQNLFGRDAIETALVKELAELRSTVFLNEGACEFRAVPLPIEAQFAPVKAIHAAGPVGGPYREIFLGGNLYDVKPSTGGRQDAGFGAYMRIHPDGSFGVPDLQSSGFFVRGQIRAIREIGTRNGTRLIVAKNDDRARFFERR